MKAVLAVVLGVILSISGGHTMAKKYPKSALMAAMSPDTASTDSGTRGRFMGDRATTDGGTRPRVKKQPGMTDGGMRGR